MISFIWGALLVLTYGVSIEILWVMIAVLLGLTLLLFFTSLTTRIRHHSYEQKVQGYQTKYYPLILGYLEGEYTLPEIENQFDKLGTEYSVFESIIFEMLENFQGENADRLRQLLFLPPIFDHHFRQLNNSDTIECIKACNYFSYIHLDNDKVIKRLLSLLRAGDKMLVFSAASSLMASNDVEVRSYALREIASQMNYSRMALLEMVYNFRNDKEDQMDAEAKALQNLLEDEEISPENVALIIEGAIEIGYMQLCTFLSQKLESDEKRWRHPKLLKVLIKAQGAFYNWEALSLLKSFISHPDKEVRISVSQALGQFSKSESLGSLHQLLNDRDYGVRLAAAESISESKGYSQSLQRKSYPEVFKNIHHTV